MSKNRDKRFLKRIEELENEILEMHEENSKLRLLIEQQQDIFKEYIEQRVRPISCMNNHLYEKIFTESENRRNENRLIRAMISDVALDIDKIASSRLGRLLFKL